MDTLCIVTKKEEKKNKIMEIVQSFSNHHEDVKLSGE
jgi:hypothetical protein